MATALGVNATHGRTDFADYVLEHLHTQSALLLGGARLIPISGKSMKLPRVLNDGSASWVAEGAELPSDAPDGDLLELVPKKLANVVTLSNESIADASVDELGVVGAALTRAVATAADDRAFSDAAVSSTAPAGLLATPGIPTAAATTLTIDSIISAVGEIEGAGGSATTVWINPTDLTGLRLIKTATGSNQPVLQPDLQQGGAEMIAGARLVSTPALDAGLTLVADAAQVVVGVREDVDVAFSSDARFTADSTVARITARFDWAVNDPAGLVLIQAA